MPKKSISKYKEILQLSRRLFTTLSALNISQMKMRRCVVQHCIPDIHEARGSSHCTSETKTRMYQTTNCYKISLTLVFIHSITPPKISSARAILFWNFIPLFGWDHVDWRYFKKLCVAPCWRMTRPIPTRACKRSWRERHCAEVLWLTQTSALPSVQSPN